MANEVPPRSTLTLMDQDKTIRLSKNHPILVGYQYFTFD